MSDIIIYAVALVVGIGGVIACATVLIYLVRRYVETPSRT